MVSIWARIALIWSFSLFFLSCKNGFWIFKSRKQTHFESKLLLDRQKALDSLLLRYHFTYQQEKEKKTFTGSLYFENNQKIYLHLQKVGFSLWKLLWEKEKIKMVDYLEETFYAIDLPEDFLTIRFFTDIFTGYINENLLDQVVLDPAKNHFVLEQNFVVQGEKIQELVFIHPKEYTLLRRVLHSKNWEIIVDYAYQSKTKKRNILPYFLNISFKNENQNLQLMAKLTQIQDNYPIQKTQLKIPQHFVQKKEIHFLKK